MTARAARRILIAVPILVALAALLACDHSPVGFDQLDRDIDTARFFIPPSATGSGRCYGKYNINNADGGLDYLILGRNAEYESRVMVRFALADSAPGIDSVDSVRFVLHTRTHHPVPFNLYAVNAEWDEYQTSWHDAQTGIPWGMPGGEFDPQRILRTDTTDKDSTIVILPHSVVDTLVNGTYGLVVVPIENDSGRFTTLYSRSSSDYSPSLTYLYGTKRRTFTATQNTYIVDTLGLNLQAGRLWLGSGYIFRSYLKFNLDSLGPESTSTVILGELNIYPETTSSQRETLSIGVHRLTRDYEPSEANAPFDRAVSASRTFITDQDTVVKLDVRSLVHFWTLKPDSNFGMLLTLEPQNYDVSRVELKRGARLPSLRIGYVHPPNGRF